MVQEGCLPPAWETENQRVLVSLEEFLDGDRLLVESTQDGAADPIFMSERRLRIHRRILIWADQDSIWLIDAVERHRVPHAQAMDARGLSESRLL